jgi:ABC-type polysaccharide/polyol phosphate export permease
MTSTQSSSSSPAGPSKTDQVDPEEAARGSQSRLHALVSDLREILHEQVEFRDLLLRMTQRDLLLRYKQTFMGFAWAVFMPLVNTFVFSVIFTRVAPLDTGLPYPLFAYSGLLFWNFFASTLKFSATSLTSNSNLVTKIYFPREIFPFSAVLVSLFDLAIGGVLLVGLMLWYKVPVTAALLFFPVVLAVQTIFTTAMSLFLAMANLFYRDIKYLFEIVLSVWMLGTSVVYPVDLIGGWLGRIFLLNPLTPIIDAYRSVLLRGEMPAAWPFTLATIFSVACLLVCWITFHRAEFKFAENI